MRDSSGAEDIVQELFVKLWNQRAEMEIQTDIRKYLFRATTNSALNYLKRGQKMVREDDSLQEKPAKGDDSDAMIRKAQLQTAILKGLEDLPPKCRTIFILNRYEGMNYQQIADHLNISFHTVKNQMTIALTRLKKHLKEFTQN